MKHFLTLKDFSKKEILEITNLALSIKKDYKQNKLQKPLSNKVIAMIFDKSSTRTRVSFETGMYHLGGKSIFLSTNDIQLGRNESIEDTANVISRMVDFVVIRMSSHQNIQLFAKHSKVPVINALSDIYHPTQLIADLMTIIEHNKENKKIAYIGDGNNMANSWAIIASKLGFDIKIASPKGYSVSEDIQKYTKEEAKKSNSNILFCDDPKIAIKDVDIVVTDTYISMGLENEKNIRKKIFAPFCINQNMFKLANKDAIFLHCLPAYRGDEVTSEVIDGKHSVIFDEAENRLHANKGILVWLQNNK
jgi:ornithine carbamoyltransferase